MTRARLKKVLYWSLALGGLLVVLGLALLLSLDPLLKLAVEQRIHSRTGMKASIEGFRVQFNPATLSLTNFKLFNPAGFDGTTLLELPELYLEVDQEQARNGKLLLKRVRFHLSELNVIKNKDGILNLHLLEKLNTNNATATEGGRQFEFGGIEKMTLTLGRIQYLDLRHPGRKEEINLGIKEEVVENLRSEEDFKRWYGALCVRIFLQAATQKLMENPEGSQGFLELLKQLRKDLPKSAL